MTISRILACLAVAGTAGVALGAAKRHEGAFSWPAPPSQAVIADGMKLGGERGLVVLERRCTIALRSFGTPTPGISRDDYVRLLVTSEDGARDAKLNISDANGTVIETIEGRTLSPEGAVTAVDETRDVTRVTVTKQKSNRSLVDLALIAFPAPRKGSILDLHVLTNTRTPVFADFRSLLFERLPALSTDLDVMLTGGLPRVGWSAMTIGQTNGAVQMDYKGTGHVVVHMGRYPTPAAEPMGVPSIHWEPLFLCYLDLSSLKGKSAPLGAHNQAVISADARGRLTGVDFPSDREREFWRGVLDDHAKSWEEFLKSPGEAKKLEIASVAPADLPVEERVRRLYGYVQGHLSYNPDGEAIDTLGSMLKKGTTGVWQSTLYLAYLLDRAGIPAKKGLVLNRYGLRFSPLLLNQYLFPAGLVLQVDLGDKPPLFLMGAYPSLPAGALPDVFQDSLVLMPSGENEIASTLTTANRPGSDSLAFSYTLDLDDAGDASGSVELRERGSPAVDFGLWNRLREFRLAHPKGNDDAESSEAARRDREAKLEKTLREEFDLPGDKFQLESVKLVSAPVTTDEPVRLSAHAKGKDLAQQVQDKWLLYVHPIMAGWSNPFYKRSRSQPVWYDKGGHYVLEGEIKLPAGAAVVELPAPISFEGPENSKASSTVEKIEKDGAIVLKSRLEFDQPYIVPSNSYAAWVAYETSLAKAGQQRSVITLALQRELE